MELRSTKKMKRLFGNIISFEMMSLCYLLLVLIAGLQGRSASSNAWSSGQARWLCEGAEARGIDGVNARKRYLLVVLLACFQGRSASSNAWRSGASEVPRGLRGRRRSHPRGRSPWDRRCQCTEALLVSGAASLFPGEGPAIRSTKKMKRLFGHRI